MNLLSAFYFGIGTAYGLYAFIRKDSVTFYFRKRYARLLDAQAYYRLQLALSLTGACYLLLFGCFAQGMKLSGPLYVLGVLPFHLINSALVAMASSKGYVERSEL